MNEIYPIRPPQGFSRQKVLSTLEGRLDKWFITLPEELRWDFNNKKSKPTPVIISLYVRYWAAVLLLHRAL